MFSQALRQETSRPQQIMAEQEDEDFQNAIAASLDTAQVSGSRVLDKGNWIPESTDQIQTFARQKQALEQANLTMNYPGYHKAVQASLQDAEYEPTVPPPKSPDNTGLSNNEQQPMPSVSQLSLAINELRTQEDVARMPTIQPSMPAQPTQPTQAEAIQLQKFTIDDMIASIQTKLDLENQTLYQADGDTYIFIDPAPQQPEQDDATYKRYRERFRAPMLMKSSTLLALYSPYFEKAFGSTSQYRVLRRRGLVGKLPVSIKYVLDLTPATEGDEAVHLLSEMCLPEGVRKWAIAGKLWPISKSVIGGKEEYEEQVTAPTKPENSKDLAIQRVEDNGKEEHLRYKREEESVCLPLDYSPIRHRSAIVRMLQAVSGTDPGLNSAAKVWTTCVLAKSFDVHSTELQGYIVSWLYRNSYYMEVLPETSLRIAEMLTCHDICRNAFAILVAEEAFESVYRARVSLTKVTAYGRRREHLPEEYQTRIEYASKSFRDRIISEFDNLVSVDWLDELNEISKLSAPAFEPNDMDSSERYEENLRSTKDLLRSYIRGAIYRLLCADYPVYFSNDRDQWDYLKTNSLFPVKEARDEAIFWNSLMPNERVLTFSFWKCLGCRSLFNGERNTSVHAEGPYAAPLDRASNAELELRSHKVFEEIERTRLNWAILFAGLGSQLSERRSHERQNMPGDYDKAGDDTEPTIPTEPGVKEEVEEGMFQSPVENMEELSCRAFSLQNFFQETKQYLERISERMTSYTEIDFRRDSDHVPLLDILGCLDDSEFKYLPLWAGGCDDGSGGVFDEELPVASAGFSEPGPVVHMGPDSHAGSSEFSFANGSNTHNTSTMTNDGLQTLGSSDLGGTFQDIIADRTRIAPSTVGARNQIGSDYSDSEYDFGSVTSTGDDAATQMPSIVDTQYDDRNGIVEFKPLDVAKKSKEPVEDDDYDSIFNDDDSGEDTEMEDAGDDDGEESDFTAAELSDDDFELQE